jgi:2-C-methyl-D-erythritol 2,4-cyclodiphosphate synthase
VRIGFGYDVHPLRRGRKMILGGVHIPHALGPAGHSDADVLCHAIGDALLGAANLGDLGKHFPDTDEKFSGISSLLLLKEINKLLKRRRLKITNIDATLLLEAPKVMPFAEEMKDNISASLGVKPSQISIKATTSEKMGFVGRKEGVAAFAVALINKR